MHIYIHPLGRKADRQAYLLTYLLTHSINHSLNYSLTYSLTYLLTYLLTPHAPNKNTHTNDAGLLLFSMQDSASKSDSHQPISVEPASNEMHISAKAAENAHSVLPTREFAPSFQHSTSTTRSRRHGTYEADGA